MSDRLALLIVTFDDRAAAVRVAEQVLAERLVACVNILGDATSLYRWEGKVVQADEVVALFKTAPIRARRLHDRIAEIHGYDLPVIETVEASASAQVVQWITGETA